MNDNTYEGAYEYKFVWVTLGSIKQEIIPFKNQK